MALIAPLLLILLFGSVELGNYFMNEHAVVKAVRDGARYAARRTFAHYSDCAAGVPSDVDTDADGSADTDIVGDVQKVVRTGQLVGGSPRLSYWTTDWTNDPDVEGGITVTVGCAATVGAGALAVGGIYSGLTGGARIVTVSVDIPYQPLFGPIAFGVLNLNLRAQSQAAVSG